MKPALLLVDLQADFLKTPGLHPAAAITVARTAALLNGCRQRGIPVIHVWTTVHRDQDARLPHWRRDDRWLCVADTPGHKPPDALMPVNGEPIVHKQGFNAFAAAELQPQLQRMNCDTVIVAGLHLHACVRAAAVECLERGFQVRIAHDAVASNDPIHAAATRRWLAERCVSFESTAALFARLDGDSPPPLVHRSPNRTREILFEVPVGDAKTVSAAAAEAREAWTAWRRTTISDRQQILENITVRIEATAEEFASQMAAEIGKPIAHGLEEVRRTIVNLRDVIRRCAVDLQGRTDGNGAVLHRPLGVIGIISAWNNPVAIAMGKIAPALACGNAVVFKPAPAATRVAESILQRIREAGAPENLVRLVTGDQTTAQHLAANENVDAVTLTGALVAGYDVQEICARRIVPLQAELSGNNAAIVWDDADFAHAARQIAWGAFGFAGQRCTANRRVILPASRQDEFLRMLQSAAEQLAWGDPFDPATEIGPVINETKRDEIAALIASARVRGCPVLRVHDARAKESWVAAGAYAQPVIVTCERPDDPLVQEESMGPVLVVQPADDFDHALALCNGVRQGLAAALFSRSDDLRERFLQEARAGVLKFDAATAGVDVTLPFGGWKTSGIGPPEHGEGDRIFYTRMQAIYGI